MDSESDDSWNPQEENGSIFNPISKSFTNQQISSNLEEAMSKPTYIEDDAEE